jgi:hypothetical protein
LLRFPRLDDASSTGDRAVLIISLVVVFPLEPVTAITGMRSLDLMAEEPSSMAAWTDRTRMTPLDHPLLDTTALAPALMALSTKSCPSALEPWSAKNRLPGTALRESMHAEERAQSGPSISPAQAAANSERVKITSAS